MRTRSKWFAQGRARGPEQAAGVLVVNAWKLGLETIKRMRGAHYEIEAGARYFDFLAEYLVFLATLVDRMAHARFDAQQRAALTSSMVRRLGEMLAENRAELLGGDAAEIRRGFVDLFNRRGEDYAVFGFDADAGPDFAFGRYLGNQLLEIVAPQDRSWVIDQVMSIEVPEAYKTLKTVLANLIATSAPEPAP